MTEPTILANIIQIDSHPSWRRSIHPDGTIRLLHQHNIPVTRENYLRLAFGGNPPDELDGEIEAELPEELRIDVVTKAWKEELEADLQAKMRKR